MGRSTINSGFDFGFAAFVAIYLGSSLLGLLAIVGFVLSLQLTLRRCAPENRSMASGLVWLQVLPLFGSFWQFVNVLAVAKSLEAEYRARGVTVRRPGRSLGIAMAIIEPAFLAAMTINGLAVDTIGGGRLLLNLLSLTTGLAAIALWAAYWATILGFSRRLAGPRVP